MNNDQQLGTPDKIAKIGSSIGSALMMIAGTPEQKEFGREALNSTAPPGTTPATSTPPDVSDLNAVPKPPAPGAPNSASANGLSGFSGINVDPGGGSIKPLFPASTPSPAAPTKPLFP